MTQGGTLCPELCGPRAAPGPVASSLKPPKDTRSQAPGPVNVTLAQTANATPLSSFRWGDDPGLCQWTPNATPSVLGGEGTAQGDSTPRGRPGTWLGDHGGRQTLPRARESRRVWRGAQPCWHAACTLPASGRGAIDPWGLEPPRGPQFVTATAGSCHRTTLDTWSPAWGFRLNPGEPFPPSRARAGRKKDRPPEPASRPRREALCRRTGGGQGSRSCRNGCGRIRPDPTAAAQLSRSPQRSPPP